MDGDVERLSAMNVAVCNWIGNNSVGSEVYFPRDFVIQLTVYSQL